MNLERYGVYGDAAGHYFHPGGELAGYVHGDNSTHTNIASNPDWMLSDRQIEALNDYNNRLNDYDKELKAANVARGVHTMVGDWDLAYGIQDPTKPDKPNWLKSHTSTPVVNKVMLGGKKRKKTKKRIKKRKNKRRTLKEIRAASAKHRLNIRKHDKCIKCYKNVVKKYKKCLKKCEKRKKRKTRKKRSKKK